ncbi:MAG: S8 family serine peptidase [Elusimicrobia bacterium]|nr:S8 family serine peptidase [Elusimicrobiota bacterium]
MPKGVQKLHARWGVKSLSRVHHGGTEPHMKKGTAAPVSQVAARAPKSGPAQAKDLRTTFRRTAVLELAPGAELSQALSEYRSNPNVEWAEPVRVFRIQGVPNDPAYPGLWGMAKIQAPSAWDMAQGNGVVVAVVDTGVDHTHPDLASNIWSNPGEITGNGIDDDGNGYVDDVRGWNFVANTNSISDGHSHGTHVSGTIAAVGNNGVGVIGVAPSAHVMAIKGLDDDGSGYDVDLAQGIVYAADNGADVINMSWGGTGDSPVIEEAIRRVLGVVLVAAAGNSAIDASQFLPAKYDSVVTVSAFNSADVMASFSNFGAKIDVAAPGVGIQSTVPGGYYSSYNGTSMACPHVAGLAALLLSQHPSLTNEQVRQAIRQSADDVGAAGFDTQSGFGRINAFKTLQAKTFPNVTITSPHQFAPVGNVVDVRGSADGTAISSRRLDYGSGGSPSSFYPIGTASTGSVTNGSLGLWNTGALPEGLYTLRLTATDAEGTNVTFKVSPVRIDHTAPQFLSVSPNDNVDIPAADYSLSASATDDYGISRIEFLVNGILVSSSSTTEESSHFTAAYTWNAGAAGAGPHAVGVRAYDSAGNTAERIFHVTVINDTTPPTVVFNSPAPNSDIFGTVTVEAAAFDNVAIDYVQFILDGSTVFGNDTSPPYRATLTTLGLSLGTHTLTATAVDASNFRSSHTITVTVIPDIQPPLLSALNVVVSDNNVRLTWTTDEPSDTQVEYGTSPALGLLSPQQTAFTAIHQADISALPPSTLYYYRAVSRDNVGNIGYSSTATFVSSDEESPIGGITSPENGAIVAGTVEVTGRSFDENTLSRVDLLVDGHYWTTVFGSPPPQASIGSEREREPTPFVHTYAQTTTWTYSLDTTQLNDGAHKVTARSFDSADHSQDDDRSVLIENGRTVALFDPLLGVPLCSRPGAACASGGLLEARSEVDKFPEPNQPNTVLGGCADGASGRYHNDESNDWVQVTSLNGRPLKAGSLVRVDAKVWAYSTKNNYLDLYISSDTAHPAWSLIATLRPNATRSTILSSTFTLPAGGTIHAVRANFRYQGTAGVCSAGDYDDYDDLAFAVEPMDVPPPTPGNEVRIGDFYARPSPVSGGVATLRVEVENADRFSQKIYSLTGQLVLDTPPAQIVETSNGWQAFESVWSTENMAAGTYYWAVEAEKEGKKIREISKLAIIK